MVSSVTNLSPGSIRNILLTMVFGFGSVTNLSPGSIRNRTRRPQHSRQV